MFFPLSKVLYYRRYVDDIICCFRNSYDARLFFEYLNSCHPNIKFTMETEERGQLPFLDVLLSKQSVSDRQGSFITSVYRKKTYTGLLTNYFSFTPFKYKLGLIKTLIDRAYKINNTTQGFLFRDKNSHIFKHLSASKGCRDKCDISCFKILDHASTYSQLKIKESFHIEQLKPELNKQVEHVSLSLHF